MSDNYQAVYDAVRSRFGGVNVHEAIQQAIRDMNLSHYVDQAMQQIAYEGSRPCVTMRPRVFIDGGFWCALYGDNVQDGVAGFGDTPAAAMSAFDKCWYEMVPPKQATPSTKNPSTR